MRLAGMVGIVLALGVHNAQALEFSCTVGKDGQPPFVFFIKDIDLSEGTAQFAVSGTKPVAADVWSHPNIFTMSSVEADDKSVASYLVTILLGPKQPYKVLSTVHFASNLAEDNKAVGEGVTIEGLCTQPN